LVNNHLVLHSSGKCYTPNDKSANCGGAKISRLFEMTTAQITKAQIVVVQSIY
jgi:hypothetical protein